MVNTNSRGQLILLGAVVLAFTIVGLMLLLNTVLFTENVTTREALSTSDDALDNAIQSRDAVETLVAQVNQNQTFASEAAAKTAVADNITRYSSFNGYIQAKSGPTYSDISVTNMEAGAYITQTNATRNFTDQGYANTDWELANNVKVRQFAFTIDGQSLNQSDTEAFTVNVTNSTGDFWSLTLYDDSSGRVYVQTNGTYISESACTVQSGDFTAGTVAIDLANGTVLEDPGCSFTFAEALNGDYTIEFENADEARGTYALGSNTGAVVNTAALANTKTNAEPYYTYVVYETTFSFVYQTPVLSYETELKTTYQP